MLRAVSFVLVAVAALSAIGFVALNLGGYPAALTYERMALIPLLAALSAAVLHGYRRGKVRMRTAAGCLVLIAVWVAFLEMRS